MTQKIHPMMSEKTKGHSFDDHVNRISTVFHSFRRPRNGSMIPAETFLVDINQNTVVLISKLSCNHENRTVSN